MPNARKLLYVIFILVTCTKGRCLDKKGHDAEIGSQKIKGEFNSAKECHAQCKKLRKEKAIRACEYSSKAKECVYHTYPISGGNGDPHSSCCVYNKCKQQTNQT